METIVVGIVNISDRASRGEYADTPGQNVRGLLETALPAPCRVEYAVVPDEQPTIEAVLREFADVRGCALIFTTGGTGITPRDVTPEATTAVCERMLPGFGEAMRAASREQTPTAIVSRQTTGVRGRCLLINLPGRPRAAAPCLAAILPALPTALQQLGWPRWPWPDRS